jgi:hypothetical protein
MGLDQYAWALEKHPDGIDGSPVDFEFRVITDAQYPDCFREDPVFGQLFVTRPGAEALAYWRKHPDLHGFIREIYRRKGGDEWQRDEFSGPVVLDLEDIEAIETATKEGTLPHTDGFFFGESSREYHDPLTLEFCRRAREKIAAGWTVVYDSSW